MSLEESWGVKQYRQQLRDAERYRDAPNRLTAAERYRRDPVFKYLVDLLRKELERAVYTPTELREAVILAATIYEQEQVRQ